jgi:hypothetical protein
MFPPREVLFGIRVCGLAFALLLCGDATADDVSLVAVGTFGEALTSCNVDSFRLDRSEGNEILEFRDHFQGMTGLNLIEGKYEANIRCQDALVSGNVEVSALHDFHVVAQYSRRTRSDHVIPWLAVKLLRPPHDGETWWIKLQAVYRDQSYTSALGPGPKEGRIADPDPGSYVVSVLSSGGYSCTREIDLIERTRNWTFDAARCAFRLDAFAHEVTERDTKNRKKTEWYQRMRREAEDFFRALDSAPDTPR